MATITPITGNIFTDAQAALNSVLDTVRGGIGTYNDFQNKKLDRKERRAAINQSYALSNDPQIKAMEIVTMVGIGVAVFFIFKDLVLKK